MSYNGHLGFGLLGDYDALPDLDAIALDLEHSVRLLARAAHVPRSARKERKARASGGKRAGRANAPKAKTKAPRRRAHAQKRPERPRAKPLRPSPDSAPGPLPAERDRRRHRRQRAAHRAPASTPRAPRRAELVLFPELALTGYPPEDLLLREHFLRDARARSSELAARRAGASSPSSASPSAPTTSTTPPRCSPTARVARDLPQDPPAQLRRLRRAALLPRRAGGDGRSSSATTRVGLTVCEDIWRAGAPASEEALAGAHADRQHLGLPLPRRQGRRARADDCRARPRARRARRLLRARRRPGRARLRRALLRRRPHRRDDRARRAVRGGAAHLRLDLAARRDACASRPPLTPRARPVEVLGASLTAPTPAQPAPPPARRWPRRPRSTRRSRSACATTSRRTASATSCSASPAASTRRSSPASPSTRSAPSA